MRAPVEIGPPTQSYSRCNVHARPTLSAHVISARPSLMCRGASAATGPTTSYFVRFEYMTDARKIDFP